MNYHVGTIATGSTGNQAFTGIGFQPDGLRFRVGVDSSGSSNTLVRQSEGWTDGTNQGTLSFLLSGNLPYRDRETTNKCIKHYTDSGGTLTGVIEATIVSLDADGFTLNFTQANANYNIHVEAFA